MGKGADRMAGVDCVLPLPSLSFTAGPGDSVAFSELPEQAMRLSYVYIHVYIFYLKYVLYTYLFIMFSVSWRVSYF